MRSNSIFVRFKDVTRLLLDAVKAWFDHRASSKGAALSFYTLFSLTPILVLAIAVVGYFFGHETAQGEIISQIESLVGRQGAEATKVIDHRSVREPDNRPHTGRRRQAPHNRILLRGRQRVGVGGQNRRRQMLEQRDHRGQRLREGTRNR